MSKKVRVLIVDDSPLKREALKAILQDDPEIQVVGMANDGREAVEKNKLLRPDVITMDLKMPVMDGFRATAEIMDSCPTPIIAASTLNTKEIVRSLDLGVMDFVAITLEIDSIAQDLISKVKAAAKVTAIRRAKARPVQRIAVPMVRKTALSTVAIGISTGGPQALQAVFSQLPADFKAGILVVQHMSPGFIQGLAEWLRYSSLLEIDVASAGSVLKSATVLLAPDRYHTKIDSEGRISLVEETDRNVLHVPSVDAMMKSVAEAYRDKAVGVIMTGMGSDGVAGIGAIKNNGGQTLAQDKNSSAIFGMNGVAIEKGYINKVVPLEAIAKEIITITRS